VAVRTIGRISSNFMVRILGRNIVLIVAADTFISDSIEANIGFSFMAFYTTQVSVGTY